MKDQMALRESLLQKQSDFDIKKWMLRVLRSWYWFAASLAIFLACAWLYLHYTNPVYQAITSIMIKDEKKSGDMSDNAVLKELGIGSNKLVENEIEILRSYDLMEEVVKSQQLNVSVWAEGRLRDVPLFGTDLPFKVQLLNPDSVFYKQNWVLHYDNNKGISIAKSEAPSFPIRYGQVHSFDGIRFLVMPNEQWADRSRNTSVELKTYNIIVSPLTQTTESLTSRLSIESVSKQASVIKLIISDAHKERARATLATLIEIYNRQGLDDKNKVTANTIDFLNERLKAVAQELQGVEGQVQQFKSANQITDISADAEQFMQIARDIDMQKAESQTKLNIVAALENELMLNQKSPGLVASTLGIQESSLTSLVEKHNSLILEKERIEKNKEIGPQNPLLIDLQQQVQETRTKLLANVRNLKEAYRIALNDISRKDEQLKRRISNVPLLEQKLVEIRRNQNVQEQLYAFLLQKREEAAVTLASNIPDSRTVVRARSLGQVSPKSKMIWIMAALFGVLVPVIIMTISDFFNNKVGDLAEVEENTIVPVLGMISHIKKIESPIVISAKSRSVVAEQIRTLRTAISFTAKGKDVKKILVTSSQPGDGKSFISLNLAGSYALLGRKTVLVELDLRKPHIAKYLGISVTQGISSILTGKLNLKDVLVSIEEFDGNLSLLPAGYLPPNPAELISNDRMPLLMEELSKTFDYVIIDTPPFGLITDAVLLQQYVDITLAVLRQGYTNRDVYSNLNQHAAQTPDYPMYAVLNGVGWKKRYQQGYGYGKYGAYSYGKGYFDESQA